MHRKRRIFQHSNTQGYPLRDHIDLHPPLVELADMIDRAAIDRVATEPCQSGPGRPILRPRLIAGLLYLQHAFNLSDEQVVAGSLENLYWQVFTGETHLQTEPPIDPSSLSRWRKRLGEVGMEELLVQSIEAARRAHVIKPSSVRRVIVDTTVIEKAIAYPTDSSLLGRSREHLVKAARQCRLHLRQNRNREAPQLVQQIGRYAHARQFRRMRAALRALRSRVGRVHRDITLQLAKVCLSQREPIMNATTKTVVGVDMAKQVYQLHWVNAETGEVVSKQIKRGKFLEHFVNKATCLIDMEACSGSHHRARMLLEMGHEVKLMPGKTVKAFVIGNKKDVADARAIWLAMQHLGVREVAVTRHNAWLGAVRIANLRISAAMTALSTYTGSIL